MMRQIILLISWAIAAVLPAQSPDEQLAGLPDSLLAGAHSVVLNHDLTYEVSSDRTATVTYDLDILLLDDNHHRKNKLVEFYDADSRITKMSASSYAPDGSEVFRARKSDFTDRKVVEGASFLEDSYYRAVEVPCPDYPCTVSYSVSKKLSDFAAVNFPDWLPVGRGEGLRRGRYRAIVPLDNELLYFAKRVPEPAITEDDKARTYEWAIGNLPPQKDEPLSPVIRETLPFLQVGLAEFKIDKHRGSFASWSDFGAFIGSLMEGRDELPEQLAAEVRETVAGAQDERETVVRLYRLLQQKTRYVSVQLGIGGWQPFSAEYVDKNAYGDCKALSNFMGAMLREVGIESYPVLIYSGRRVQVALTDEFATSAFNHMILYVPSLDTYLECTSKYSPPGYVGSSIRDRRVLWITPEGGRLARTPEAAAGANGHTRTTELQLTADGGVEYAMHTAYFGADQELFRGLDAYIADRKDQLDWLHGHGILPDVSGESFTLKVADRKPIAEIDYRTTLHNRTRKLGRRMFLPILTNPYAFLPDRVADRSLDVETIEARTLVDTVIISLPAGYEVESGIASEPYTVEHEVGTYRSEISPTPAGYRYVRSLTLRPVRLPATRYADVREFFSAVSRAERAQLVLREKRTK